MNKKLPALPFYEDMEVGDKFQAGEVHVTLEMIKKFAAEFDPQPIHLDEEVAKDSLFGELVGSGWHTAALTMGLMARARPFGDRPMIGVEVQDLKWPVPMRPGDTLSASGEVIKMWRSKSKPLGFFKFHVQTRNQDGVMIFSETWTVVLPTRD